MIRWPLGRPPTPVIKKSIAAATAPIPHARARVCAAAAPRATPRARASIRARCLVIDSYSSMPLPPPPSSFPPPICRRFSRAYRLVAAVRLPPIRLSFLFYFSLVLFFFQPSSFGASFDDGAAARGLLQLFISKCKIWGC